MPLETVFLLLGWGSLGAILVTALCSSEHPEADRVRDWINIVILALTLIILAWTGHAIVDQVTEMRKVYPEVQSQAKAMASQVDSFIATERARMFLLPTEVHRSGDKDSRPRFTFMIVNMGRTAALVKGILIQCNVSPTAIGSIPSYEAEIHPAYSFVGGGFPMVIPAGDNECVPSPPLTEDDVSGLAAKTKIILFKGYILYQDVLGQTWQKRFGMYGYGDGKFFSVGPDAYNAEEKVKLSETVPISAAQ
jgi:hypothetical protein